MRLRQKPKGRPGVDENILRLAVYVASLDELTRTEQCEMLFRISHAFERPLLRVPAEFSLRRWLALAAEKGITLAEGRDLYQSIKDENE